MCLRVAPGTDCQRYNLPTADEVAVILPTNVSTTEHHDIILQSHGGMLQWISDCHPAYAPLQCPLLFPYGENGWHPALEYGVQSDDHHITQSHFAAYRLHNHIAEFSCVLHGGHLFTWWLVDMYASLDQNRLLWMRLNQGKLRAALYSGLQDAINTAEGEVNLADLGQ